jgi:hypothetical protein
MMGDSNINRYYDGFYGLLAGAGYRCVQLKTDKTGAHQVDSTYYDRTSIGQSVAVHDRDCWGCSNKMMKCQFGNKSSITVERLAMEFTSDAEVTSFQTYHSCAHRQKGKFALCPASTTSQQFLLKEYLAKVPPDLLVVFGNSHDSARFTLREQAMNVRTFSDMLDIYLPSSTTVVWTSKPSEYINKKPEMFRGTVYESGTMNIMQWLREANKMFYREMRNKTAENNRPLMFLDLQGMSEPVLSDWNFDGVHMHPVWYQHFNSYFMQTLCTP